MKIPLCAFITHEPRTLQVLKIHISKAQDFREMGNSLLKKLYQSVGEEGNDKDVLLSNKCLCLFVSSM